MSRYMSVPGMFPSLHVLGLATYINALIRDRHTYIKTKTFQHQNYQKIIIFMVKKAKVKFLQSTSFYCSPYRHG